MDPSPTRYLGCLFGGAVGDALGAPVEFLSRAQIVERFGAEGVTDYAPDHGGIGRITDDTQMTLFTAEGLLRAWVRGCFRGISSYAGVTAHAYLRWLRTQGETPGLAVRIGDGDETGWLYAQPELHARRAPGATCLAALRAMPALGEPARNDSKGCGGVMRVAPAGLFARSLAARMTREETFALGVELAALTHGHPTGALTAGVLALLVRELAGGEPLRAALDVAVAVLRSHAGHEETLRALGLARRLAGSGREGEARAAQHAEAIAQLGQGWVAEEALAIALYCALVARDFRQGVLLAVNHDGDADSTGAIAGNLLGALLGQEAIPAEWLARLELRPVIEELARDLHAFPGWEIGEYAADAELGQRLWAKYPGY